MPGVERSRSFLIASKVAGMKKPGGSDSDKGSGRSRRSRLAGRSLPARPTSLPEFQTNGRRREFQTTGRSLALLIALIRIVVLISVFAIVFPGGFFRNVLK